MAISATCLSRICVLSFFICIRTLPLVRACRERLSTFVTVLGFARAGTHTRRTRRTRPPKECHSLPTDLNVRSSSVKWEDCQRFQQYPELYMYISWSGTAVEDLVMSSHM